MARFVPIVRTFVPIVAGVSRMNYRTFVTFNVLGGLLWAVGVTTAGYILGDTVPEIDKYLLPIIALIVFLSILPPLIEALRHRRAARRAAMSPTQAEAAADDLEQAVNED